MTHGTDTGIAERLAAVLADIREAAEAARRGDAVTLVAVTKTVQAERVLEAYAGGQRTFGENRVQEGEAKRVALADATPDARWHLIGHLQSNKARAAAGAFDLIESVDSISLAERLGRMTSDPAAPLPIFVEVNVAAESSKHGVMAEEVPDICASIAAVEGVQIRGLMTVAPLVDDPEDVRWVFRRMRQLRDELRMRPGLEGVADLSMGMSGDYRVAIEEGATMVRIGRAIFGERPPISAG